MISMLVSYQYEIYGTTVRENCVLNVKYDIVFVLHAYIIVIAQ